MSGEGFRPRQKKALRGRRDHAQKGAILVANCRQRQAHDSFFSFYAIYLPLFTLVGLFRFGVLSHLDITY